MNHFPEYFIPRAKTRGLALFLSLCLVAMPVHALQVSGAFTGWWGQPDQQNHGLIVSISRLPSGERIGVIYWAHFDEERNPTWLLASGSISGDRIEAELFEFDGITFMQPADTQASFGESVGTFEVQFADCQTGTASYAFFDDAENAGEFPIQRITDQPGVRCTGGLSDDFSPFDRPQTFRKALEPTEAFLEAEGEMRLDLRPGQTRFRVTVENLPEGVYQLQTSEEIEGEVKKEIQGEFDVVLDEEDGVTRGRIRFRSPQVPNHENLDFDPRGKTVEVLTLPEEEETAAVIVLFGELPEESGVSEEGDDEPPFDLPENGSTTLELIFEKSESAPEDGSATLLLETRGAAISQGRAVSMEFEVSDIGTSGSYLLRMGERELGFIEVAEGDTFGELAFGFPPLAGELPLNFDPAGETFQIFGVDGETVLFSLDFPEDIPGTFDNEDDDPGNGDDTDLAIEIAIELEAADGIDGSAEARWNSNPDRKEFSVRMRRVEAGDYELQIGEAGPFPIEVGTNGQGRIKFVHPLRSPKDWPLDFEVLGKSITIIGPITGPITGSGDAEVAFTGTMPAE